MNKQTETKKPHFFLVVHPHPKVPLDFVLIDQIHHKDCFTETEPPVACHSYCLEGCQRCTLQQHYTLVPWGKTVLDYTVQSFPTSYLDSYLKV